MKVDGVKFKATAAWTASVNEVGAKAVGQITWLRLSAYQGPAGDVALTLSLDWNDTGNSRNAEVRIVSGKTIIVVAIEQKAEVRASEDLSSKIPDRDFRKYLIDNFDADKNGKISTLELAWITSINIDDPYYPRSFKGIEYCVSLSSFDLRNTRLDTVDLSAAKNLEVAYVFYSNAPKLTIIAPSVEAISVSGVPHKTDNKIAISVGENLKYLGVHQMNVDDIDFSHLDNLQNLSLQEVEASSLNINNLKQLSSLDLQHIQLNSPIDFATMPNLNTLFLGYLSIPSVDLSRCEGLIWVDIDSLSTSTLSFNDVRESLKINNLNAQILEFGQITQESVEMPIGNISKSLTVRSANLEEISVRGVRTENLDLKGCLSLKTLNIIGANLLNINNPNSAAKLKIIANDVLEGIIAADSFWQEIDLTQCAKVATYHSVGEPLATSFKLRGAEGLKKISIYNDHRSTDCESIDLSGNVGLERVELGNVKHLRSVNVSSCPKLDHLSINARQTEKIILGGCSSLTTLACENSNLESLDLSSCTKLAELRVSDNKFTSLDLSPCPELVVLRVSGNKLTSLDLSMCRIGQKPMPFPEYNYLKCVMESLQTLYLKTGCQIYGVNMNADKECILPSTAVVYK